MVILKIPEPEVARPFTRSQLNLEFDDPRLAYPKGWARKLPRMLGRLSCDPYAEHRKGS